MALRNFFKHVILSIKSSKVLSFLVINFSYVILRSLYATYRFEVEFDPKIKQPFKDNGGVFYFWHQQIIAALYLFFRMKSTQNCIVSSSKDGIIAGKIISKIGFNVIYGSSFKNPIQVTRQSLRLLREGKQLCIVGDGSRGPAFQIKRGVTFLAETANVPLYFVECSSSNPLVFKKSWDKFQVPLPFSKIKVSVRVIDPSTLNVSEASDDIEL